MTVIEKPRINDSDTDNINIQHAFCGECFPGPPPQPGYIAMCGWVHNGRPRPTGKVEKCVVCVDLFDVPCPRCGAC